jgi:hypothetical protein
VRIEESQKKERAFGFQQHTKDLNTTEEKTLKSTSPIAPQRRVQRNKINQTQSKREREREREEERESGIEREREGEFRVLRLLPLSLFSPSSIPLFFLYLFTVPPLFSTFLLYLFAVRVLDCGVVLLHEDSLHKLHRLYHHRERGDVSRIEIFFSFGLPQSLSQKRADGCVTYCVTATVVEIQARKKKDRKKERFSLTPSLSLFPFSFLLFPSFPPVSVCSYQRRFSDTTRAQHDQLVLAHYQREKRIEKKRGRDEEERFHTERERGRGRVNREKTEGETKERERERERKREEQRQSERERETGKKPLTAANTTEEKRRRSLTKGK